MAQSPTIAGVRVDLHAIRGIAHTCDPRLCASSGSCCACYEVTVTEEEVSRAIGLLPNARRYARGLGEDICEETDDGLALATNAAGRCVFAFKRRGQTLCALHAASSRLALDPYRMKPWSCTLWPLAVSESHPPVLGVQDGAFDFPCNHPRDPAEPGLDPGIADTLRACYGQAFLQAVLSHLG
jgi:hypothetical protein